MTPADFNLPAKFTSFRENQIEAIPWAVNNDRRFRVGAMPVGSGKSLFGMAVARHFDRTATLTVTKGLMGQYSDDYSPELVNIQGRNNYLCDVSDNCKIGGHLNCTSQRSGACPYIQKFNEAKASDLVLTNYAYWLNVTNKGNGIGEFDCLILDEAHDAAKMLSSYLDFQISEADDIERFRLPSPNCAEDLDKWKLWVLRARVKLEQHLTHTTSPHHKALEAERMETMFSRLDRIESMTDDNWVCEEIPGTVIKGRTTGKKWRFDCVWPGMYREMLFRNIPNVILMSGTARPSISRELGIKRSDMDFRSWDSTFPRNRSPFYHVKCVSVKYGMSAENERKWVEKIDEIIESRYRQRKGIIHTVSYARQRLLLERSRFAAHMLANTNDPQSETAAAIVERFRNGRSPSILVSPSFGTGWDFPGDQCEWQIITNIPFPPMISKVMKRRKELDPTYQLSQAAKELAQALGRPMRFEKDRAETFIVDDRIGFFVKRAGKFLPEDFSYNAVLEVPAPGPRWNER